MDATPSANQKPPVILLVYANDRVDPSQHLRNLSQEINGIRDALKDAEQAGLCQVVIEANATADRIFSVFQDPRYRNRIAIFHYAGHANGYQWLLESADGARRAAHAAGLATFLREQRGLELVFLNGCSTDPQVEALLNEAGCAAAITTSQAIDDEVAMTFAEQFYRGLAGGQGLESTFNAATGSIRADRGDNPRALYWGGAVASAPVADRWPWELRIKSGAERVRHWNLPEAAENPLFGLPALPPLDLPESPFRHLSWFDREHAVVFFGRGFAVRELYDRVTAGDAAPILLFYGESGVGKSSVLAAGLLPRLEADYKVHHLPRKQALGLLGTLMEPLGPATDSLGAAWRRAEEAAGQPLLLILDQVEEVFKHSTGGHTQELATLIEGLRDLFGQPDARPRGRLILSFRKEWLPEINARLAEQQLPRAHLFLEVLDRPGVIEAVSGPTRSEPLRHKYGLEIELGLAEEIAGDLLADPQSPVAPTLQILLTKLWERAREQDFTHPKFTRDLYLELKRKGFLLGDFLDQQLHALEQWRPQVVQSGLALDLLAFHTTAMGAAEQRTEQELLETYGQVQDTLPHLVQRCKDDYLLADIPTTKEKPIKGSRLAHDILAPLVRERFEKSDRPGQRARRILESRAVDWAKGQVGPMLDAADLAVVERGAPGMRVRTDDEVRLLVSSREDVNRKHAEAEHQYRALQEARTQAGVRERERERAERVTESLRLASEARFASTVEPEAALLVAWEALLWDQNELTEDVFRETLDKVPATVRRLCDFGDHWGHRMTAGYVNQDKLVFVSLENGQVWLLDLMGKPVSQFIVPGSDKLSICLVKKQDLILAVRDRYVRLYNSAGLEIFELDLNPKEPLKDPVLSCNSNGVCVVRSERYGWVVQVDHVLSSINLIKPHKFQRSITEFYEEKGINQLENLDLFSKEKLLLLSKEFDEQPWHRQGLCQHRMAPSGSLILTESIDGTARIWTIDGTLHSLLKDPAGYNFASTEFLEGGKKLVTGTIHQGNGYIWNNNGELLCNFKTGKGSGDDLFIIAVNQNGDTFATTNRLNYVIDLWSSEGILLGSLSGHTNHVCTAAFSPDCRLLVSGSSDRTVRVWDCQAQRQLMVLHGHTDSVIRVEFSEVRQREVISSSADGSVRLWSLDAPLLPAMYGHRKGAHMIARTQLGVVTSSYDDSTTCLWNLNQGLFILPGLLSRTNIVGTHHSLACIATIQESNIFRIWRIPGVVNEEPVQICEINIPSISDWTAARFQVIISPDESRFLVATDTHVNLYLTSGTFLGRLIGAKHKRVEKGYDKVKWAGFSQKEDFFFTAAENGMVWLWSSDGVPTGSFLADYSSPDSIFNIALDPLGEFIAVCLRGKVSLWTWKGELSHQLKVCGYKVCKACFSLDGSRIVTITDNPGGSPSYVAQIWSRHGDWSCELVAPKVSSASTIAFDSKNRYVCLSSGDSVRIYDLDGELISLLGAPLGVYFHCLAISPDGEKVAASFSDGIVRLWSLHERRRTANFFTGIANCMIFSSDSRRLLVATAQEPVKQYAIHIEDLFQAVAARVNRTLTADEIARFAIQQPVKLDIRAFRNQFNDTILPITS